MEVVATAVGGDLLLTDDHIGASGDAGAGASGCGEAHGYTASGRYSGRARGRWRGRGRGCGRARMHPYPSSVVSNTKGLTCT